MILCDKCEDATKAAQFTSLAIVTHDKMGDDLESFEYEADHCDECRAMQRQAIETALNIKLTDASPKD